MTRKHAAAVRSKHSCRSAQAQFCCRQIARVWKVLVRTETSGNDGVSRDQRQTDVRQALTLATGTAAMTGAGGDVNLLVGSGDTENGTVVIKAGSQKGGGVFITSGAGTSAQEGSGGDVIGWRRRPS